MNKDIASRGGKATLAKHGTQHFAEIGRAGFAATVAKNWGGDAASYLAHQRKRANQAVADALADIELRAELEGGKSIAAVELPVYLDPDEDISWVETVSRQGRGRGRAG